MSLALLHRENLPAPAASAALDVRCTTDAHFMATLQNRTVAEMRERFADGHRAYVAYANGEAAAWGWVATRVARIGELSASFAIPAQHRYLWNFVTLPQHRGKGLYPRLLQSILHAEASHADVFWIAYAPENKASASGIHKAGFTTIATLSFDDAGRPAATPVIPGGDVSAAQLLGIAVADTPLSQCWRCARAEATDTISCKNTPCCCDYQRPQVSCA